MSRRALAVAAALGAAVLVLLLGTALGWWHGAPSGGAAPAEALTAQPALSPNPTFFGDPVEARVTVGYDAKAVDGSSIRVETSFAPYAETAPAAISRTRAGSTGTVVYTYRLQCLTDGCVPLGKARTFRFRQAVVTAASNGSTLRVTARWPQLVVSPRLTPAQASGNAHFRSPATVPAPAYAVAPGSLSAGLVAAAAVLGLGALVLLAIELRRLAEHRRARAVGRRSRRALALAYAREAAARDDADRRKALGLLAETLADEGEPALAASAVDVAWSEAPPTPEGTLALVDEVERAGPPEDA